MNQHASILDGNVKRVLTRFHGIKDIPEKPKSPRHYGKGRSPHAEQQTAIYTQGIMDLGATLCTRRQPDCPACPMHSRCKARLAGTVDQLPSPKPKKTKPVKTARFLL